RPQRTPPAPLPWPSAGEMPFGPGTDGDSTMDALVALAISIGILIAGWTYVALGPGALPVWAGIIAWGCFFAAGGKTEGLAKTIASNLSGVLWAFLALTAWNSFGGGVPVLS